MLQLFVQMNNFADIFYIRSYTILMFKQISLFQAFVVWLVIYFTIAYFVPTTYTNVIAYGPSVSALALVAWWASKYFI